MADLPRVVTDEVSGKRYRIQPLGEYFEKPHMPASRHEVMELLILYNHNRRVGRPWWRAVRFLAAMLGMRKTVRKLRKKGAIKLLLADK